MVAKIVWLLLATLSYVFLLTVLFEYCLNKASDSLLTTLGILLFILFTVLYIQLFLKTIKGNYHD